MRRLSLLLALAFLPFALATAPAGARAVGTGAGRDYIVVYGHGPSVRSASAAQATTARLARRLGFAPRLRYRSALQGFAARIDSHQVRALRRDPRVALVWRDRRVHATGRSPVQPGETVSTGAARIGAVTAAGVRGPSTAGIAVIDTGIDLENPQLNVRPGVNCVDVGSPPDDEDGHGTFVAGVAAARNDGDGVVGVTPGTPVWAVKALASTTVGQVAQVVCGIDWVTAHAHELGIRVANLSLGGDWERSSCEQDPLHQAICASTAAGVTYVVAAGNDGRDFGGALATVPAVYPEVLTATAMADSDGLPGALGPPVRCPPEVTGEDDDRAFTLSNWATRPEDAAHVVAAPGVCIASVARHGGLDVESGTSAAAPYVAGVISLCAGEIGGPNACAAMTPAEIIQQVRADAVARAADIGGFLGDPANPIGDLYFGYLVSGLDPGVRRLAATSVTAPSRAPARDRSVGVARLRVLRTQALRKLRARITLREPGSAWAAATVRIGGAHAARVYRLHAPRTRLAAYRPRVLRLRRPARQVAQLSQALGGASRQAIVTVHVADRSGNVLVKRREVRVRP